MALSLNKMSIAELTKLISDAQAALAKKQEVAEKVRIGPRYWILAI
jgi:hypothetical protein